MSNEPARQRARSRVDRILRRTRRAVAVRDLLTVMARAWLALAAIAGVLFARWYRLRDSHASNRRGTRARKGEVS